MPAIGGSHADLCVVEHVDSRRSPDLHKNPDRLEEVNKEISEFGCKVVAQYAVLGAYDFISIIEALDNETAAHLSVDLGSRGSVNITTLPLMPIAQFVQKLRGSKQMGRS